MSAVELVVSAVDDTVEGIRTLHLCRPDGAVLASFTPGSHLVVECGAPDSRVANAYSLTGESVAPRQYVVSVLESLTGSGGSRWMHQLAVGDTVVTRAPRSAFPPVQRATRHLFVAAGIGITPMISHLRSAHRWGRHTRVLYLHRPGRGAYVDDVRRLADDADIVTSRDAFTRRLATELVEQPFGTHLYVCGPSSFMDAVTAAAAAAGWPASRVHLERFGIDALDPGEPFEVTVPGDGSFVVAAGVSLLEALEARGHTIANLCRQGVCGECRVTVAAADRLVHRDWYLTGHDREAGDSMMCCVSRAAGRLELSL